MVNSTLHLCGNTRTWSTHGADGPLFQELLAVLKQTADKHRVSIANAGVRYVLERPAVAGVIVGTRLGVAQHLDDNARVFGFATDSEDEAKIETVLAKSRNLFQLIGRLRRRISLMPRREEFAAMRISRGPSGKNDRALSSSRVAAIPT
jgi:diketogulonate reductase-like aldo/keto reductase